MTDAMHGKDDFKTIIYENKRGDYFLTFFLSNFIFALMSVFWFFLQLKHVFTNKYVHMCTSQTSQQDKNNMMVIPHM